MIKDKHIISELKTFFHENDCNKAINCIITTIRHLNLRSSCIGIEKRHNCKLSCLQVLELLLVFPFFMVKNSFQYHHSGLTKLFSCRKDMFYRFMEQDNIDWRKLVYMVSLRLLKRISSRKDSKESLQCLIIDDTDLPKTGFKTEMIGVSIHTSFTTFIIETTPLASHREFLRESFQRKFCFIKIISVTLLCFR